MRNIVRQEKPASTLRDRMRSAAICLTALLATQILTGCPGLAPFPDSPNRTTLAPFVNENVPTRIPDEYIIVFKPGTRSDVALAVQERAVRLGGTIKHVYRSALMGFSAKMSPGARDALRADANVAFIEANQNGSPDTVQDFTSPDPNWPIGQRPKGLDRTSERSVPLDSRYTYSEDGTGVHVYVIDTGIRSSHTEFGGRVLGGTNVMGSALSTDDCGGHGTFMAGIIGGAGVGIAKGATLHPVRVTDCSSFNGDIFAAGIDWVVANRLSPAVINFSHSFVNSPTLDTAVTNAINAGIVIVVSAGNGTGADACVNTSPARVNAPFQSNHLNKPAIVVGAVDPDTDTRTALSNIGACLNLFSPGANVVSAGFSASNSYIMLPSAGTSSAAAHVTGVVARYLQTHPTATPAQVWSALHLANNVYGTTTGWSGLISPGTGSPNELLHYGSLNNGQNDGDPHITTVNNIYYHFQVPGEFVALREANGMEIQTRQTPVPGAEWVSINTAVAIRMGTRRVTWQPGMRNDSKKCSASDPHQLELRIDDVCATTPTNGLYLGDGGRIMKSPDGTRLEVNFPDETRLIVAAQWWPDHQLWYLNLSVFNTPATDGIMGAIEQGSWEKQEFTTKWKVTPRTSLFYYPKGVSTETFSLPVFPNDKIPSPSPENRALAQRVCGGVENDNLKEGCRLDVEATGDPIFAKSARIQELTQRNGCHMNRQPPKPGHTTEKR